MGMMAILDRPTTRPKRGRPRADDDPAKRREHVECAIDHLGRGLSLSRVARLHGVSKETARRWIALALSYDDPECEGLRRLAGVEKR